ncbi:hypothetical protein AAY473_038069 [Plecturocebus cupreus]
MLYFPVVMLEPKVQDKVPFTLSSAFIKQEFYPIVTTAILHCCPGLSTMAWSQLTATSDSWVRAILLPQVSQGLAVLPRLENRGVIMAHCILELLGSSESPTEPPDSASGVAMSTGIIIEVFLCCPSWSGTPGLQWSSRLGLPVCWDYRPGDSRRRNHAGRRRDSFGRRGSPGATLLAAAAVLPAPSAVLPGAEYTGRTGSAGPIPTRKTAIGSAEDGEFHSGRSEPGKRGTGVRQRKTKKQKNFITGRREIQNGRVAAARDCGSR